MKAMILAAGYGTRLRPLTYVLPKPVFPVCNKPMIAHAIDSLRSAGVGEFIINLHHLPDPIEELVEDRYPDFALHFSLEHEILGTGGGLRRVRRELEGEPAFLLVNGDTIQSPPYRALLDAVEQADTVAALALRHPPAGDRFTPVFADGDRITGFGSGAGEALMFSGAHAIRGELFREMPDRDVFGIVESVYARLAGERRLAAVVDDGAWFDVGTPQRYLTANAALRGKATMLAGDAVVTGAAERSVVGARCSVRGVVRDTVLWDDCTIGEDVELSECIVADCVDLRGPMSLRRTMVCREDPAIPRDPAYRFEHGLVFAPF